MGNPAPVRVRIAPSPTGRLHVGTARAALFNELFARRYAGTFILRFEDTDPVRSQSEYELDISEGLEWLGLRWDEGPDVGGEYGPYRQSERKQHYQEALQQLLDSKAAYKEGEAIKLKVEPQAITFPDDIRGEVRVHTNSFAGDFIIARSINDPLYHVAVVVDDAAMKISHVIRGEDHLHNTVKHILIQRALGYNQPVYAHLPLLLDVQRRKLSKRSGETSLLAYRDRGFLPEAMLNYLALLGWSAKDDREYFNHDELAELFSLAGVQKSGAIFSETKLTAMNKHYLRKLDGRQLLQAATPFLQKSGMSVEHSERLTRALEIEQQRVGTLAELPEAIAFFLPDWQAGYAADLLIWKKRKALETRELLGQLTGKILTLPESLFSEKKLEQLLLHWIDANALGRGDTLWPMRVALTGREHSPSPFQVAAVIGKEESIRRLRLAQAKLPG